MLRLHEYQYHRPAELSAALELLHEREDAMPISGGTDLMPNMKHRLWTPNHLVALKGIPELRGIRLLDADPAAHEVWIGAGETLFAVSSHPLIRRHFPSLAAAAGKVAGPQIRNRGTIGGNLCLDTRCTYYNQSLFWRQALGFCLKKDGDICHVTKVGRKCVAAHSADTPPVLMTLGAQVELASVEGRRAVPVADFFIADGEWNSVRRRDELVIGVRIPLPSPRFRGSYRKLRQRGSIDFPLLSVALGAQIAENETVQAISLVVTALGSRPRIVSGLDKIAVGRPLAETAEDVAQQAHKQCHPLENIIVDPDWRRAMVPVQVRRALAEIGTGA